MDEYLSNKKKKNKCIKAIEKRKIKASKVFTTLKWLDYLFMPISTIILVLCSLNDIKPSDTVIYGLIFIFFIWLVIHLLPQRFMASDYLDSIDERISIDDNKVIYRSKTFNDPDINASYIKTVLFDDLTCVKYDEETFEITFLGKYVLTTLWKDEISATEDFDNLKILNCFDVDVIEELLKRGIKVEYVKKKE